jgi:hypothetical protein
MASVGARLAAVTRSVSNHTPVWRSTLGARALSAAAGGVGGPVAQPALASEPRFAPEASAGTNPAPKSVVKSLSDDEIFSMTVSGQIKPHELEKTLGDRTRAVAIRRRLTAHAVTKAGRAPDGDVSMAGLPHESFDATAFYTAVDGSNCENVIG